MSLSTLCSSTKLICPKETVVSSGEDLCHLIASSCSVIVVCVKLWHLMAGLEAGFVRSESDICFQPGNPRGLWRSLNERVGKRIDIWQRAVVFLKDWRAVVMQRILYKTETAKVLDICYSLEKHLSTNHIHNIHGPT